MTDKMTAEQALEMLADMAHMEVEEYAKAGGGARVESLQSIVRKALTAPRVPDVVAPHCDYGYITPAKGNSWFAYDPEGDGMLFFETEEEARAVAQKSVSLSLDEFWSEDVDRICYGRVTHAATQVNRSDRPESLDEEGYDEDGEYWPADCEFKCNYELLPITAAPAPADELANLRERVRELEANYSELLCQVHEKIDGQTCHQTALSRLRSWNAQSNEPVCNGGSQ